MAVPEEEDQGKPKTHRERELATKRRNGTVWKTGRLNDRVDRQWMG